MSELFNEHSLSTVKSNEGTQVSGAFSLWSDTPVSPYAIGDTFQPVPGGDSLKVSKIAISDNVIGTVNGKVIRQWKITVEGDSEVSEDDDTNVKYTFSMEQQDSGLTIVSGSMAVSNTGSAPSFSIKVGEQFHVPGVGNVICTKINGGNETGSKWNITYDGAKTDVASVELQKDTEEISYKLNGVSERTVSGEFIALRRSLEPVTTKSITKYTHGGGALTTIGSSYAGGIALSERVIREVVMSSGLEVGAYYRHDIEVEG